MDKIILSSKDVDQLLQWRDKNRDLIRRNAAPFKGIILDFPETKINIKAINDAGRITFYINLNGIRAGKISGQQLPGGLFKEKKNTTKLHKENIQSIITVYSSLMALIVYHRPEPAPGKPLQQHGKKAPGKEKKQQRRPGKTYLFRRGAGGPAIVPAGGHARPAAAFNVRGHYRHYKNGKTVWIRPYVKGSGKEKNKTYKL